MFAEVTGGIYQSEHPLTDIMRSYDIHFFSNCNQTGRYIITPKAPNKYSVPAGKHCSVLGCFNPSCQVLVYLFFVIIILVSDLHKSIHFDYMTRNLQDWIWFNHAGLSPYFSPCACAKDFTIFMVLRVVWSVMDTLSELWMDVRLLQGSVYICLLPLAILVLTSSSATCIALYKKMQVS